MKIAIVGSRDYPDLDAVFDYVRALPSNAIVVSGGARGVDTAAIEAANSQQRHVVVFPAQWQVYGNSAGMRRNALIVEECDELVAFWDGTSKGTAHSIELARKAGKPVTVFTPEVQS